MTKTLVSDLSRHRERLLALSACALVASAAVFSLLPSRALAAAYVPCSASVHAPCLFGPAADGGFEIDGNQAPAGSL